MNIHNEMGYEPYFRYKPTLQDKPISTQQHEKMMNLTRKIMDNTINKCKETDTK